MTKDELLMILKFAEKNKISEIKSANILGFNCKSGLSVYKKKYGIPLKKQNETKSCFPIDDIIKVIDYAEKNKISENSAAKKLLGISTITNYKRKYNLTSKKQNINPTGHRRRKYDVDDSFFNEPNILNSYYAGFIAADGYISDRVKDRNNLIIGISSKDRKWLETFKEDIKSESPITDRLCKKVFHISSITIKSEKICEDLKNHFGIVPRKSLILTPPQLTDKTLKYAFICGYIDGDGTLTLIESNRIKNRDKSNKVLYLSILGTEKMCKWIKSVFSEITDNKGSITRKKGTKIYNISFSNKSARSIVKVLSEINVPKLKRKWSEEIVEHSLHFKNYHFKTVKWINVFDIYGNFIVRCDSLIDAAKFCGCSINQVRKASVINNNTYQANGYMFSQKTYLDKYVPPINWSGWNTEREKLIKNGKIKNDDFTF